MAESFRDEGKDVLLFVDNIFRFTCWSRGICPVWSSPVAAGGYQPNFCSKKWVCCKSVLLLPNPFTVQAAYVPADDMTDPAPATTFAHL